ncbi:phosphopantetheine-binding protein, partial [Piscicoccus intestinalis]|uniref:phosphopantetheine-binding protein n=1 Tax=Piscicoccus intestinalis TaxID=746033 RepID=UPI000A59DD26
LAAYSGRPDAITGTVVSGRDDAPGSDAAGGEPPLLGMLTDTVPLLVAFDGAAATALRAVADQTAAALVEPPVGLAALSTALGRGLLFDSLLVVENYPTGDAHARAARAGLQITALDGADATHYPLSLTVETDGPDTRLRLEHDPAVVSTAAAQGLLDAVRAVLTELGHTGSDAPAAHLRRVAAESLGATSSPSEPAPRSAGAGSRDDIDALTAVFAQLLAPGRRLDADANFFALGGDSILAMSLVTAARDRGLAVRPGDVFVAPTPRALAERVTRAAPTGPSTPVATPVAGRELSPGGPDTGSGGESNCTTTETTGRETNPNDPGAALIDLDATGAAALDDLLRNL